MLKSEEEFVKNKFFQNVYCKNCKKVCAVSILDNGTLTIDCNCARKINITSEEFKKQYLHAY